MEIPIEKLNAVHEACEAMRDRSMARVGSLEGEIERLCNSGPDDNDRDKALVKFIACTLLAELFKYRGDVARMGEIDPCYKPVAPQPAGFFRGFFRKMLKIFC